MCNLVFLRTWASFYRPEPIDQIKAQERPLVCFIKHLLSNQQAFELSEQAIKPSMMVVLDKPRKAMLHLIRTRMQATAC